MKLIQPIIDVMDTEIIIVRYMDNGFMVIRFNKMTILRQNNEGTVFCFDRDFNDRVIIQSKGVFHISKNSLLI